MTHVSSISRTIVRLIVVGVTACLGATSAKAQGSLLTGRVLADSVQTPLVGAEVSLPALAKSQRTDERGEFRVTGIPAGEHVVQVRMPGYAPKVDTIEFADAGEARREYRLARIEATLPEVPVKASLLDRKLFEFHERRRMGIGRFLDSAEFAKLRGIRTSDRLAKLPAVIIMRGGFSDAYVANNRQRVPGENPRSWCKSAVWLDGVNLGIDYNINQLDPSIIVAIEWYAGQASIPAKFNTPPRPGQTYCGVLVVWTR
jgi:carboxypeptidase family protein